MISMIDFLFMVLYAYTILVHALTAILAYAIVEITPCGFS